LRSWFKAAAGDGRRRSGSALVRTLARTPEGIRIIPDRVGDARVADVPPRVSRSQPVPCPPGKRTIPPTVRGYWIDVSAVADAQTIVI
jgi:hypothetical protein